MAKWGMAIDLRRCAGCYACVVACQMHNSIKPGIAWNHVDAREWGENPDNSRCYLPHACMHCEDAPCVNVCPTGASQVRDDGIVVVDYDACIDCGSCLLACPYNARVRNAVETFYFDAAEPAPYEEEGADRVNVVEKCIFCAPRVDKGLRPACVVNCPGKARTFGDLDDPESDINALLSANDAVRIGETSFYYVPVEGMPRDLLPQASVDLTASKQDEPKKSDSKKAEPGIPVPAVVGGVAAVAAVGAGVAVGVTKSRRTKEAAQAAADAASAKSGKGAQEQPARTDEERKGGQDHE